MGILMLPSGLTAQQPTTAGVILPNTRAHTLTSAHVHDRFVISVGLPASYVRDSARRFAVLYVLDADKSFGIARDVADWLSWASEVEPLIVVGIGYENQWWPKRARDMTFSADRGRLWGAFPTAGGGAAFLRFLQDELIPFIERTYRSDSTRRTLAGLSFGGLFGMEALLSEHRAFAQYIMIGPAFAWDSSAVVRREAAWSSSNQRLEARVYTAIGEHDDPHVPATWRALVAQMSARRYVGLELMSEVLPGETHVSAWPVGLTRGLRRLFGMPPR
jgi:hypothetical protein